MRFEGTIMTMTNSVNFGGIRVNTRANTPRTSSNSSFRESMKSGMASGVSVANSALRQVTKPIPGGPALSATINDAARNLAAPSSLSGSSSANGPDLGTNAADADIGSLQSEMLRNNQDMLEQQLRVSQITTDYSTRSYILKAMFDSLKTIGSNIR